MIRTDYLPRICAPGVVERRLHQRPQGLRGRRATPTDMPTMPIEFSVAAFRLGHSMIRAAYNWNRVFADGAGTLELLFEFSGGSGELGGGRGCRATGSPTSAGSTTSARPDKPDLVVPPTKFNRACASTPGSSTRCAASPVIRRPRPDEANLAFRNLTRAQHGAARHRPADGHVPEEQGRDADQADQRADPRRQHGADLDALTPRSDRRCCSDTPLWFYILREAEFNGGRLKGVGARIVAETFHRAIEGSTISIVRDPAWRPTLGPDDHDLPDGRSPALRLRGQEGAARPARLAVVPEQVVHPGLLGG